MRDLRWRRCLARWQYQKINIFELRVNVSIRPSTKTFAYWHIFCNIFSLAPTLRPIQIDRRHKMFVDSKLTPPKKNNTLRCGGLINFTMSIKIKWKVYRLGAERLARIDCKDSINYVLWCEKKICWQSGLVRDVSVTEKKFYLYCCAPVRELTTLPWFNSCYGKSELLALNKNKIPSMITRSAFSRKTIWWQIVKHAVIFQKFSAKLSTKTLCHGMYIYDD